MLHLFSILSLFFLISGCQSNSEDKYLEKPVTPLYQEGLTALKKNEFKKAAKSFEEVIRQHPYSHYATKAQLMAAFSYYKAQSYEEALASINAFIQMHPSNSNIPYAFYLKGLCYYNQVISIERDQDMTEKALASFSILIQRFPSSPYAKDSKVKIDLLKEYIAGAHMDIGRFYERQFLPISALNRFKFVVKNYETTSHTPEALFRLVEVYLQLGIIDDAQACAVVLGHNFPGSTWYQRAFTLLETRNLLPPKGALNIKKTWNQNPDHVTQPYHS